MEFVFHGMCAFIIGYILMYFCQTGVNLIKVHSFWPFLKMNWGKHCPRRRIFPIWRLRTTHKSILEVRGLLLL